MTRQSIQNYALHYVYRTEHPTGLYYIGVHSSDDPEGDSYKGSGKRLKQAYDQYPRKEWRKIVIETFERRIDADHLEGVLVCEATLADPMNLNSIRGIRR